MVVTVLIGLGLLQVVIPGAGSHGDKVAHGEVVAASVLPLLLRRRFPFLTLVAVAVVVGVSASLSTYVYGSPTSIGPVLSLTPGVAGAFALLVATTFSAAAAHKWPLAWTAFALSLTALTLEVRPWLTLVAAWLPAYPTVVVAFVAGRAQRERWVLTRALEDRLLDLQARREQLHRLALQEARASLARDLHDVVVHALEQMRHSAQEATAQLDRPAVDPEPAISSTEAAGRTALSELRRLLHVLRTDDGGESHGAQPDLRRVQDLVRASFPPSVEVRLDVQGDMTPVPPAVALAAYRIVQEALTNTRRHSDPERVEVRLEAGDAELRVEVHDYGRARELAAAPGVGLGILGMRERVSLFGGTLHAAPRGECGFSVVAQLPLGGPPDRCGVPEPFESSRVAAAPGAPPGRATPVVLSGVRSHLRRLAQRGWPVDVVLVGVLVAAAWLEFDYATWALQSLARPPAFSSAARIWAVAWILLLLLRRRAPVLTGVAMAVMAFLQSYPFGYWTPSADLFALSIAVYTIGSLKPRHPHAWVVAVLGAVGVWSIQPLRLSLIAFLAAVTFTLGGAAYVGRVVGERRRLIAELEERMRLLAEERRTELALAIQRDRLGTAREMHDLVAHAVGLMVLQAGAARTVAATDPQAARRAMRAVAEAGRQVVPELNQLLSLLRGTGADEGHPSPRRDVEALVDQARQTGLEVNLQQTGSHRPPVGSSLETFEYRIVQEALTNVRKHAPGSRVQVRLRHDPGAIVVRVANDGATAPPHDVTDLGAGQGLMGMRERVAMVGGSLKAGPSASGGFVVEAVMPRELPAA